MDWPKVDDLKDAVREEVPDHLDGPVNYPHRPKVHNLALEWSPFRSFEDMERGIVADDGGWCPR